MATHAIVIGTSPLTDGSPDAVWRKHRPVLLSATRPPLESFEIAHLARFPGSVERTTDDLPPWLHDHWGQVPAVTALFADLGSREDVGYCDAVLHHARELNLKHARIRALEPWWSDAMELVDVVEGRCPGEVHLCDNTADADPSIWDIGRSRRERQVFKLFVRGEQISTTDAASIARARTLQRDVHRIDVLRTI